MMPDIILASGSQARQTMLHNAGAEFEVIPANIDEEAIQKQGGMLQDLSLELAKKKALAISKGSPNRYIIGSDQILSMGNQIYSKAKDKKEARERLKEFSGKIHILTSSVAVVKNDDVVFENTDQVSLKMKNLSAQKIDDYMEVAGGALTQCVGCYAIEGAGIRLFEEIKGDYFTILGMPLLPLLNFLDKEELL